ncbi:hypothetical protein [Vibrio parahaemolyticus]|uniref:hypothetical protein n=1 Tax=Vibrio parahaemolyticus TaxID=670 RepID=UPI001EEB1E66|nr:hypothetical protein [Vibrio parahaemolyticus]ELB2780038.1 hypothetical protein [Vibrio parahaemolyticus]MCG6442206.1 hypothetical protein [Vibrio parahaemolyticus]MCG6455563.1 hypothetical protein [Vibrio parahaemolyticus]
MDIFSFYVTLRKQIIEVITGTDDAEGSLFWDDTTPNWLTKQKLQDIYNHHFGVISKDLGVYVVERHFIDNCPNDELHGDWFPEIDNAGIGITHDNDDYTWTHIHPFEGEKWCHCPCHPNNSETYHRVMETVVYDNTRDHNFDLEELLNILGEILVAIDCAEDRRPRSAIRENLLCAVIRINDQLLPQKMDDYIKENIGKLARA